MRVTLFFIATMLVSSTASAQALGPGSGGVCTDVQVGAISSARCDGITIPCRMVGAADVAPEPGVEVVLHCTNRNVTAGTRPSPGDPVVNRALVVASNQAVLFDSLHHEFGYFVTIVGGFVIVASVLNGESRYWVLGSPVRNAPLMLLATVSSPTFHAGYADYDRWSRRAPPDLMTDERQWRWDSARRAYVETSEICTSPSEGARR